MDIAAKLQIKLGATVAVLGLPDGVEVNLPEGCSSTVNAAEARGSDAVIVFTTNSAALAGVGQPAVDAALDDRLAWVAYPKAGKLGTDLNRDVLARLMLDRGTQPVRQVAIDQVWSALRFRPRELSYSDLDGMGYVTGVDRGRLTRVLWAAGSALLAGGNEWVDLLCSCSGFAPR